MAIRFGTGLIIVEKSWEDFKSITSLKKLPIQYDDTSSEYKVFAIDGQVVYLSSIFKDTVPSVSDTDQSANDSYKNEFLGAYFSGANYPSYEVDKNRNKLVEANFRVGAVPDTDYYLLIDLNNESGKYKHTYASGSGVKIAGITGLMIKSDIQDSWSIRLGTILSISASGSEVGWIRYGTMVHRDTADKQIESTLIPFPMMGDFTAESGSYKKIATNFTETETRLSSSYLIPDVSGVKRAVQPGDIILRPTKFSGNGSLLFHYHVWYLVE